jgi:hypothetical protein
LICGRLLVKARDSSYKGTWIQAPPKSWSGHFLKMEIHGIPWK